VKRLVSEKVYEESFVTGNFFAEGIKNGYLSDCFSEKKPALFFVENATNK